jgi:hypothetical protein
MGSVSKVQKKVSARGGSARRDFVKRQQGCCFQILSFFRLASSEPKFVENFSSGRTEASSSSSVNSLSIRNLLSPSSHHVPESRGMASSAPHSRSSSPPAHDWATPPGSVSSSRQSSPHHNPKKLGRSRSCSSTLITYGTKKESSGSVLQ